MGPHLTPWDPPRAYDRYTEGVKGVPMTADQAWRAAAESEARQAEIMGQMAANSAQLYRSTLESLS